MKRLANPTIFVLLCVLTLLAAPGETQAGTVSYQRSVESYTVPDVTLIDQNGSKVRLKSVLDSDQPILLNFIFATCTTICPVLSASFMNFQQKLGADTGKAHLVSISIDPENDTPKVTKEYLKRFQAKPGWDYLTGTLDDVDQVTKAFNAFFTNKMNHAPLMFIKAPNQDKWVRLDGFLSTSELMDEYKKATAQ
jgi:protein SCO1/2